VTTAIIVNDRGEAFVGWRSSCSLSENGVEMYSSVPFFAKETVLHYEPGHLWDPDVPTDKPVRLNRPYVFSSVRAAARAARRMWSKVAVVT